MLSRLSRTHPDRHTVTVCFSVCKAIRQQVRVTRVVGALSVKRVRVETGGWGLKEGKEDGCS